MSRDLGKEQLQSYQGEKMGILSGPGVREEVGTGEAQVISLAAQDLGPSKTPVAPRG